VSSAFCHERHLICAISRSALAARLWIITMSTGSLSITRASDHFTLKIGHLFQNVITQVLSDTARYRTLRSPKEKARHENKVSVKRSKLRIVNQLVALPENLLRLIDLDRLIAGDRATAIIGIEMSFSTKIYSPFLRSNKLIFSKIKERGEHLIFLVTTAMTSFWAAAERRKVANMAREREIWYELIV
jgi:hypothetical protein